MDSQEKIKLPDKEISGLMNLMKDSEEKTLKLIAQQINSFDYESLRTIDELAAGSNDDILIDSWYYVSKQSLSHALKEWRKNPGLESGLFLLSRLENPGVHEEPYRKTLDEYAQRVANKINDGSSDEETLQALNQVLFAEEGFKGNQVIYYDSRNNFLHSVIEDKTGNPITLSAIYILVARRLNIAIEGVGTPGHFIVKFKDKLIDPFFEGREITKDECHIRAQELGVFWKDEYLEPVDDEAIIVRSIRNLIAIHKRNKELDKASDASELLNIFG